MIGKLWPRNEHQRIQELFSAYLDERLTPAERAQVDTHLRGCASCARDLETLRGTVQLVRRLPPVRLPRDFSRGLVEVPAPARGYPTLRGATALAAAVFVCVLSIDLGSQFFGQVSFFPAAPAPPPSEESRALEADTPAAQLPYEGYGATEKPTPAPEAATSALTPQPTETAGEGALTLRAPSPTAIPTPAPIPRAPGPGGDLEREVPFPLSPLRALEIFSLAAFLLLGTLAWRRRAR